jgi:DNA repair protein RadA
LSKVKIVKDLHGKTLLMMGLSSVLRVSKVLKIRFTITMERDISSLMEGKFPSNILLHLMPQRRLPYIEKKIPILTPGVKSTSSSNGCFSSSMGGPPLANDLEHYQAENFLHALILLDTAPLEMHNLRLKLQLIDPRRYYDLVPLTYREEKKNKAKVHEERIGDAHVTFRVYPIGTVEISIACSKSPFRVETDWDVTKLISFVGEVRNKLQSWLRDVNDSVVPTIEQWYLIHADINKDVKVSQRLQLTFHNMQLQTADRVLRIYVKNLGQGSVMRFEEMRMFNEPFIHVMNSIRKGASSSTAEISFTHSLHPAAFVEIAGLKCQNAMLVSQMAEMREELDNVKLVFQEKRLKENEIGSEQVVVYDKEKEEAYNIAKSDSSSDDGYKQTPFHNSLTITTTNGAKVEKNKNEMFGVQQVQQPPIAIPPSTTPDDIPIISSAAELLEQRNNSNNHLRISTGSKRLDDLLGGGIERGAVTELIGPAGTGKTELCLTLSVMAQQQEQKRKLGKTSVDDGCKTITPPTRVLFLGIKKASHIRRIYSITQARGIDADTAVESITVEMLQDFRALEEFILKKLEEFLKKNPETVLVIVDSIIALQPLRRKQGRKNKGEKGDLSLWQQSEYSPIYLLRKVASQYNIAVVAISEAENVPDCSYEQTQIPIVGNIISRASTFRISFKNHDNYKVARIIHSPCHPEGEVPFTIEGEGITDIHQ